MTERKKFQKIESTNEKEKMNKKEKTRRKKKMKEMNPSLGELIIYW